MTLAERLERAISLLPADTFIETRRDMQAILSDVRELERAASAAMDALVQNGHTERVNEGCDMCNAYWALRAILYRTIETKEST